MSPTRRASRRRCSKGYLRAASQISRLAVGDRGASATSATYRIPQFESQMRHVEGTPFGARGGMSVVHTFPADGDYVFQVILVRTVSGELYGNTAIALASRNEPVEILVNGERVALIEVHAGMNDSDEKAMTVQSPPVHLKAGPQRIAVVFPQHFAGPVDDLMSPIDSTLIDTRIGTGFGITALPHIQDVTIQGPMRVTGVSETPSRQRIFTCRPTTPTEEEKCAVDDRASASPIRRSADRVAAEDLQDAMEFYGQGREQGTFEDGIRLLVQSVLAHPRFVFRAERAPAAVDAAGNYRIGDIELASRLSFFLWGTVPDQKLMQAALQRTLSTRAGLAGGSPPHARGSARGRAGDALRVAVAAPAGRRQDPSRRPLLPVLGSLAVARVPQARPSSSSTVSSARIAACSICSPPITRSSTSASRGTTAFRTSPAPSSDACTLPEPRRGLLGRAACCCSRRWPIARRRCSAASG